MKIEENYAEKLVNAVVETIIEAFTRLSIEDVNMYQLGYSKAIQDFYDKILNFEDYINPDDIDGTCLLYAGRDITDMIVKIKNELLSQTKL